jgi:hypothetical protein
MKFRKHLFISYAHIDNAPVDETDVGFVTRLHTSLQSILEKRLGRKAEIWRDVDLQGNDVFAQEIMDQFKDTAALVAVVSPRYVESKWCLDEARAFCDAAQESGGQVVDNQSRIFKLIALPVDSQEPLPAAMRDTLGFDFYVRDPNGVEKELNPAYDPAIRPKLLSECARLAQSIARLVKTMEAEAEPDAAATATLPASAKATVYLAECSFDRRSDRNALRTELQMRGHTVLPDRQLPQDEGEYATAVARLLDQCSLAIHLVGSERGAVCDGQHRQSVVEIQNELAVRKARASELRRIISLPEGTGSTDSRQQRFIDALHREPDAQFAADVITADLEAVKDAVRSALARIETPPPVEAAAASAGAAARTVYLIFDERDRKATLPLRRWLNDRGLEVQVPVFEGDAASVRVANQERLARCDAALIFYGAGTDSWKATVEDDIRKAAALRTGRPAPVVFTWLAEPITGAKTDSIDLGEANVIDAMHGAVDAAAEPLLTALGGPAHG